MSLRKLNEEYERKHGRTMPEHLANKISAVHNTKLSAEEQDRKTDWDEVPVFQRPSSKIKGLEPAERSDPNRKKKVMVTKK